MMRREGCNLARMSGMLDLSRDEKAKHFLPRWLFNVANVELLPIPMLPAYNCPITAPPSLKIGIGSWQHFHNGNIRRCPAVSAIGTEECFMLLNRSQFVTSSLISLACSINMNSDGNRSMLRFTAWFRAFVGTPYSCSSGTCPRVLLSSAVRPPAVIFP